MNPNKALGPDDMNACFWQKYWHIMGKDASKVILNCLNSTFLLDNINHTNIALIPKVRSPRSPEDYRPISLCNVFYKIIAKVIANHLKVVLDDIISPNQSAFVPSRMIFDNAMIAYETIHTMKMKNSSKHGNMALKLDMSKAYDRVEW